MNNKIEKLLDLLIQGIEKGTDLAGKELPIIMEEILNFHFWHDILGMSLSLLLFILCLPFCIYFLVRAVKTDEFSDGCLGVLSGIGLCIISICLYNTSKSIMKIKIAPRLYVIEYVKKLK